MSSRNPYGANLVNFLLIKEQVFIPFRSCYYLLYQCLVPNTREALSLLVQHYSVPKDFKRSILSGENPRVCNQGILNYLLIMLRRDKNFVKFWDALRSMINHPDLRVAVERVQKGMRTSSKGLVQLQSLSHYDIIDDVKSIFPLDEGALSVTDSDDDYCVSYAVTMVDVRSCTRPPRSPDQLPTKLQSHYSVLVRSMPDDYMNTVSQLECHLTGDHIGSILKCKDAVTANQRILDCLIEQINTKLHLLDFCDWLSTITDAPALTAALNDVIAALEVDNFNSSAPSCFNVKTFIHSNCIPGVLDSNSAYKPLGVLVGIEFSQFGPKGVTILKKHYYKLWMSLPEDYEITLKRFIAFDVCTVDDEILIQIIESSANFQLFNMNIVNILISFTENDKQLLGLSFLIERLATGGVLTSDCPPEIESFRSDCLQIIKEKVSELNIITSADNINVSTVTTNITHTTTTTAATAAVVTGTCAPSISQQSNAPEKKLNSGKPCMKDLQSSITLNYATQWMVIGTQLGVDYRFLQIIGKDFPSDVSRCCNEMLQRWLQSDCNATWDKIWEAIKSPTISKARHQNNTTTELQYQPPPTCPAYHVPRVELLKEISSAILNSDITPTIGTTVIIRGIGGIGKSTIAKALCHDPLIKEYFVTGFLWISLTSSVPNLITKLSEIYQTLTGKSAVTNATLLITRIKALISKPSCKLLVILDDVWEAKDAMDFIDLFSNCKIVMTTRKMDINVTIPPIKCFDVQPMSIDEAVKLLTLKIEALHATDVSTIQKLAEDLHCWPFLLNLVHGQLYVHCVEWNEPPQDAILNVHHKLFDHGLTAFDLSETSRENAVRASIDASLKLRTKDELYTLLFVALSIIGLGTYTFKDVLSAIVDVRSELFNECTRNLWCHGLIIIQHITFPNVIESIPCIGTHEIIGQFITDNMSHEFNVMITNKSLEIADNPILDKYFCTEIAANVGEFFLSKASSILIPFLIRLLTIHANYLPALFVDELNILTEQNASLMQNMNLIQNILKSANFPQVRTHRKIKQDCGIIHSLLADGKHNVAILWAKHYFPSKLNYEPIFTILHILKESCKSQLDHEAVDSCKRLFKQHFEGCERFQNEFLLYIIGYKHVQCLVNAAASDDDVRHYLKCSVLYRQGKK